MTLAALQDLRNDDLAIRLEVLSNARAIRKQLLASREVRQLRHALETRAVTESAIRSFVGELLQEHRPGEVFAHSAALAAVAVGIESRPGDFAEEYLHHLSRLRQRELRMPVQVARECLDRRYGITRNKRSVAPLRGTSNAVRAAAKLRFVARSRPRNTRIENVTGHFHPGAD